MRDPLVNDDFRDPKSRTWMQNTYTPSSSVGLEAYPSRHTRHAGAHASSSSSSSPTSSTPRIDAGDASTAMNSPGDVPRLTPRGDVPENPGEEARGPPALCDPSGDPPSAVGVNFCGDPGGDGDTRVIPMDLSVRSRSSIALFKLPSLVVWRRLVISSRVRPESSASSIAIITVSESVPTCARETDSSACSSGGKRRACSVELEAADSASSESATALSASRARTAASRWPITNPRSAVSASATAGLWIAADHPPEALSSPRAPSPAKATSSRYPVTESTAPHRNKRFFNSSPSASPAMPSASDAQHRNDIWSEVYEVFWSEVSEVSFVPPVSPVSFVSPVYPASSSSACNF
mmetsp:Transcript_1910/g.7270  ORF Transcript_1910/g.7270 Transcript_1910/m.7270 type:complete len:351 (-) Transcript_1910:9441-10493(-)